MSPINNSGGATGVRANLNLDDPASPKVNYVSGLVWLHVRLRPEFYNRIKFKFKFEDAGSRVQKDTKVFF